MDDGRVADGDVGADVGAEGVGVHMHDGAVLEVGALADADLVHVAADDDAEPQVGVLPDLHVADDGGRRRDENIVGDAGQDVPVGQDQAGHGVLLCYACNQ